MRDSEDQELRGIFRNLREEDGGQVPAFDTLWSRAQAEAASSGPDVPLQRSSRHRIRRRLAWGGSLLAAAATAAILLLQLPGTSDSEFVQVVQRYSSDPAAGAWQSPTDGLLDLPGSDILSTVPSIKTNRWLSESGIPPRRNDL